MNIPEHWKKVDLNESRCYETKNESGTFYMDRNGVLTGFVPSSENMGLEVFVQNSDADKWLRRLIIPEGVRELNYDKEGLCNLVVIDKVTLPKSLEKVGNAALFGCRIMEMELPPALRVLSSAFIHCHIHQLRIPSGFPSRTSWEWEEQKAPLALGGRQFKDSTIDTLIVPWDYPYERLMPEAKINRVIYTA